MISTHVIMLHYVCFLTKLICHFRRVNVCPHQCPDFIGLKGLVPSPYTNTIHWRKKNHNKVAHDMNMNMIFSLLYTRLDIIDFLLDFPFLHQIISP